MRIPAATYRLQFHAGFGFDQARAVVGYLSRLGISDLYASPIFAARRGSTHGYDVTDPDRLNPELGEEKDFETLGRELRLRDMGWLQDFVPNHMAYAEENPLLSDLLERGEGSPYRDFFDIDWEHPDPALKGRLLAPFLGRPYRECLCEGAFEIRLTPEGFGVHYGGLRLPLRLRACREILQIALEALKRRGEAGDSVRRLGEMLGILDGAEEVPLDWVKRRLWMLYTEDSHAQTGLDEALGRFNRKGEGSALLDALLSRQVFRLSYWKSANERINYRRFFAINDLISIRVEKEAVFRRVHGLLFKLLRDGPITGIRLDHIDGLYDPAGYLKRLRRAAEDVYVVVEKILDQSENLPGRWPVQGTTGYDFLSMAGGLFCDPKGRGRLQRAYARFTGQRTPYRQLVYEKKRLIARRYFFGDMENLARLLLQSSSGDSWGADLTVHSLTRAITEAMACFPVYRSYVHKEGEGEEDRARTREALAQAHERNPELAEELGLLERALHSRHPRHLDFIQRFQQYTGPLTAKGVEDTVFYLYNRLISLNEVGGSPDVFGTSLAQWHAFNIRRSGRWPHALNATATHDTKRGEDARMRIHVLSELAVEWSRRVDEWHSLNLPLKRLVKGQWAPDLNDEYLLYQALLGSFPFQDGGPGSFSERFNAYLIKAVRESKLKTSWIKPDVEYEKALIAFSDALLAPTASNGFLKSFLPFQRAVAHYGILNSLSQTLVKLTAPGVPDFYQGTELWDFSFVDPDNRRPVDFEVRARLLEELLAEERRNPSGLPERLLAGREDGRLKLFLIHRGLSLRRHHPALFEKGAYRPVEVKGRKKDHVVAFMRQQNAVRVLTVVPRFCSRLVKPGEFPVGPPLWSDTRLILPDGAASPLKNALTGRLIPFEKSLPVGEVLQSYPVALLIQNGGAGAPS